MKVKAILTDKGNYIAQYHNWYFYVGKDRKTLLRLADQQEFENAAQNWEGEISEQEIANIAEIIELSALSEKVGFYIDTFSKGDLESLDIENYEEQFSYVNNSFNYVKGFYNKGNYENFSPICGGSGTSEAGNHGTPTSWGGETYVDTLKRYIKQTGQYPELMITEDSDHQSRQGDGYGSKVHVYILPNKDAIQAYFENIEAAYAVLKTLPITIK